MDDKERIKKLEESIRWIAQTNHQGNHADQKGTFVECPKNTCQHAADVLGLLKAPTEPTGVWRCLSAELREPCSTSEVEWVDVLSLRVPEHITKGTYRLFVGMISSVNASTRLTLTSGGLTHVIEQCIDGDDEGEESFSTGDERDLSGGETLTLQFMSGYQEEAVIEKASLNVEPAWDEDLL